MIDRTFAHTRAEKRAALVTYVMAGDPTIAASEAAVMACIESGADIVEIGIPFTDPIADGPTIQAAASRALRSGTTTADVLSLAARVHARAPDVPIVLMGYLNPILAMPDFFERCEGVSALLCPDLPADHVALLRPGPVALPLLVAPTTPPERVETVARAASGFLYYVSVTGTTGARRTLPSDVAARLGVVRARSPLPVVVGFGVHAPEQVAALAPHADGVVVGSAIVERAAEASKVRALVGSLRAATA